MHKRPRKPRKIPCTISGLLAFLEEFEVDTIEAATLIHHHTSKSWDALKRGMAGIVFDRRKRSQERWQAGYATELEEIFS